MSDLIAEFRVYLTQLNEFEMFIRVYNYELELRLMKITMKTVL